MFNTKQTTNQYRKNNFAFRECRWQMRCFPNEKLCFSGKCDIFSRMWHFGM